MHEHLRDLRPVAGVRELRETKLRRADGATLDAIEEDDDALGADIGRERPPPRLGISARERPHEADGRAGVDRVIQELSEVRERGLELRQSQDFDVASARVDQRNAGMTSLANAASASQSYGPARSAMLSWSAPASR